MELLGVGGRDRREQGESGVVHEGVDLHSVGLQLVADPAGGIGIAEVPGVDVRGDPVGALESLGSSPKLVLAPGHEHHVEPVGREQTS